MPIDQDAIRRRIQERIDADDDLSMRNVSMSAGMSDSALHKYLTGQNDSIRLVNIAGVADAIGVSLDWLLFGRRTGVPASPLTEDVLEQMIGTAFEELEPEMQPEEIARIVASNLHAQLARHLAGGEVRRLSGARIARDKAAQSRAPTTPSSQEGSRTA